MSSFLNTPFLNRPEHVPLLDDRGSPIPLGELSLKQVSMLHFLVTAPNILLVAPTLIVLGGGAAFQELRQRVRALPGARGTPCFLVETSALCTVSAAQ